MDDLEGQFLCVFGTVLSLVSNYLCAVCLPLIVPVEYSIVGLRRGRGLQGQGLVRDEYSGSTSEEPKKAVFSQYL